jgi:FAD synthetase
MVEWLHGRMAHKRSAKVLVFGTFDHLHPGHVFVLNEAQKRGEVRVIVARDRNVERIKGTSPNQSEDVRQQKIQKTFPTIEVVLGDSEDF